MSHVSVPSVPNVIWSVPSVPYECPKCPIRHTECPKCPKTSQGTLYPAPIVVSTWCEVHLNFTAGACSTLPAENACLQWPVQAVCSTETKDMSQIVLSRSEIKYGLVGTKDKNQCLVWLRRLL